MTEANAASREARARQLLAEHGQEPRVLNPFDDVRCYLAPNQVLPAMLALAGEAASQPREGVETLCERVYRAGLSDGWRCNQQGKKSAPIAFDEEWHFYVKNGALAKSIEATLHDTAPTDQAQGWIVGDGSGLRWRYWDDFGTSWTPDREKATRYARREDAEAVHAGDEDAWRVVPYATDQAQGGVTPEPAPQDNAEIVERCARIAADAAEGSRILHNAAAKDHDRDGCNIHAEGWRTGLQIAAAIRALATPIQGEI